MFTHEEQPNNVICRHLSISSQYKGMLPDISIFIFLLGEFGFVNQDPTKMIMWPEPCGAGQTAINVIEPLSGDYTELMRKPDAEETEEGEEL